MRRSFSNFKRFTYPGDRSIEFNNIAGQHESWDRIPPTQTRSAELTFPLLLYSAGTGIWEQGVSVKRNNSNLFSIELIRSGKITFRTEGKQFDVPPGSVYITRPGIYCEAANTQKQLVLKRFVTINGIALFDILHHLNLNDTDICTIPQQALPRLNGLMRKAYRLLRNKPPGYVSRLSALAYELMVIVAINQNKTKFPTAISSSLHYMSLNIDKSVTVAELAHIAGMSVSHFHRLFSRYIGQGPNEYFIRKKMNHIARVLQSSTLPIKQIALKYGYKDQAYFGKLFKRICGVTPQQYRFRNK